MDYVDFKTAKIAKEIGFDEFCDIHYTKEGELESSYDVSWKNSYLKNNKVYTPQGDIFLECTAPTLHEYHKWLIKEHKIFVNLSPQASETAAGEQYLFNGNFGGSLDELGKPFLYTDTIKLFKSCPSFEEALSEGLYQASLVVKSRI